MHLLAHRPTWLFAQRSLAILNVLLTFELLTYCGGGARAPSHFQRDLLSARILRACLGPHCPSRFIVFIINCLQKTEVHTLVGTPCGCRCHPSQFDGWVICCTLAADSRFNLHFVKAIPINDFRFQIIEVIF